MMCNSLQGEKSIAMFEILEMNRFTPACFHVCFLKLAIHAEEDARAMLDNPDNLATTSQEAYSCKFPGFCLVHDALCYTFVCKAPLYSSSLVGFART